MDTDNARSIVKTAYPRDSIIDVYSGILGGEELHGFRLKEKSGRYKFAVVYSDGSVREPNGPMTVSIARSLTKL